LVVLAAQALEAKKACKPLEQGRVLERGAVRIKRVMGLTAKVSGPQNAGPLDRRVRPEGQKEAPGLGQGRSPRKSAGPRKRGSAARMIAGGACYASGGGQKGLKAFGTGPSAEISGCAHRAGDGTNAGNQRRGNRVRCIDMLEPARSR